MKGKSKNNFYNNFDSLKLSIGRLYIRIIFLFFAVSLLFILSSSKPEYSHKNFPPETKDTIFIYDTVYLTDTLYSSNYEFDTLKSLKTFVKNNPQILHDSIFDLYKNPFIFHNITTNKHSVEFFAAALYSKQFFKSDLIYCDFADAGNSAQSPLAGFSTGAVYNFFNIEKNTQFSAGLGFSVYRNKFNYPVSEYTINTISFYRYFERENIRIDTILFINIDTLLATGDTIYEIYPDTNYVFTIDSVLQKTTDTLITKIPDKTVNKYTYFEVPVIFGKVYNFQSYTLIPEIGFVAGFILNADGKIVSLADINQTRNLNTGSDFTFINLSLHLGLKAEYYLNKRWNVSFKIYYRNNINSLFGNYPIILKNNVFAVNFGMKYKI